MWRPFDARFADLLERMSYHRNLVNGEVALLRAKAAKDGAEVAT